MVRFFSIKASRSSLLSPGNSTPAQLCLQWEAVGLWGEGGRARLFLCKGLYLPSICINIESPPPGGVVLSMSSFSHPMSPQNLQRQATEPGSPSPEASLQPSGESLASSHSSPRQGYPASSLPPGLSALPSQCKALILGRQSSRVFPPSHSGCQRPAQSWRR